MCRSVGSVLPAFRQCLGPGGVNVLNVQSHPMNICPAPKANIVPLDKPSFVVINYPFFKFGNILTQRFFILFFCQPAFATRCGHVIKFLLTECKQQCCVYSDKCPWRGFVPFSLPFFLPASWNADLMAGAGTGI